jgi:hypothetical protein
MVAGVPYTPTTASAGLSSFPPLFFSKSAKDEKLQPRFFEKKDE